MEDQVNSVNPDQTDQAIEKKKYLFLAKPKWIFLILVLVVLGGISLGLALINKESQEQFGPSSFLPTPTLVSPTPSFELPEAQQLENLGIDYPEEEFSELESDLEQL